MNSAKWQFCINYRIKNWFSDWFDSGKGDFTVPKYTIVSGGEWDAVIRYDGDTTISHDTAFKNVVIRDSLPFQYIIGTDGMYKYVNHDFFPLDNRGFGNEGRNHNFSFTMALHWNFVKTPGQSFKFSGDDDFWVLSTTS